MRYLLLYLFFLLSSLTVESESHSDVLTFACSIGASERQPSRLLKELTKITAHAAGYKVEFVEYPWSRVVATIRSGTITGSYCISYLKQREEWVEFIQTPFAESSISFYKNVNKNVESDTIEQLLNLRIGVYDNGYNAKVLSQLGAKNLTYVHNHNTICRLLWEEKIDLVPSNTPTNNGLICAKNPRTKNIKVELVGPEFTIDSQRLGISRSLKDHQKLAQSLNASFIELIKQGKIQELYRKYQTPMPQEVIRLSESP